ncbi:MAG: sensor histidine kinase [Halanaeroarchaeum sp.]
MNRATVYETGPLLIAFVGLALFAVAASHHLTEVMRIEDASGPLVAFTLDGVPALGLVAGGVYLSRQGFDPENDWRVLLATVAGGSIVIGIIGLGILVRAQEGQPVSEPAFQLLIGATAGSVAGFVAGFFYASSMERATQASKAETTLGFTNSVLRHDIKNDMTVIRGRARAILDAHPEDDIVAESARTIDSQVDEVLEVIDSTSAIAETLSDDPDYEAIDIADIAREVVERQAATLPATVTVDAPEAAAIHGNDAVRTVLSNLTENAVEHNDAENPRVHVAVEVDAETVWVRVSDNGPGIADSQKRTLFDPRPADTGRGGLHVVSTLVENFGGDIRVEDNEPRGSVFVVEFPRTS